MTEQLRHLLREEGERLDVPPPPTDAILAGARRSRRSRQTRTALAVAASVAVIAGGLAGVAALDREDGRGEAPDVATPATPSLTPTPTPTPSDDRPPAGSLELSGSRVGEQPFGTDVDEVMADVTARFGEPDVTVGPERYARIPGNGDTWFEDAGDTNSRSWDYPVASVSCWRTLCLVFGGSDPGSLALRGWELAELNRWNGFVEAGQDEPDIRLADSGIRLGDSWRKLHAAYPTTIVSGGEGAAVAVEQTPWRAISDGVAAWRLSGEWDYRHPRKAPAGAVVTRLSAGEGPEPGCC